MALEEEALKGTECWHKGPEFSSSLHFSPNLIRRDTAEFQGTDAMRGSSLLKNDESGAGDICHGTHN